MTQAESMVFLYKLIVEKGFCELASGHLSFRDPNNPNLCWMMPYFSYYECETDEFKLSLIDINQQKVINGVQANFAGIELHSEIYATRSDVNSIGHFHGPNTVAFSTLNKPLKICFQEACIFYEDCGFMPFYGGLVDSKKDAKDVSKALGNFNSCVLANHGSVVVGDSLEAVGFRLFAMERTCWTILKCGYDSVTEIPKDVALETKKFLASSNALKKQYFNYVRNHGFSKALRKTQ